MMPEVPPGWRVSDLSSLCERPGEYGANVRKRQFDPILHRYVRITDVTDDGKLRSADPVSIDDVDADKYVLEKGDVLFARSGATVGKTYLYRQQDGRCAFAGYLIRFKPVREVLDPQYLFYYTHSPAYLEWVKNSQRAQAQPNINVGG